MDGEGDMRRNGRARVEEGILEHGIQVYIGWTKEVYRWRTVQETVEKSLKIRIF